MKQKRRLVAVIRKQLHPPVSKMTRLQICQYVYGTTKEMDVDWTPYFEKAVQRKRIPKGCFVPHTWLKKHALLSHLLSPRI